MGFLFQKLFRNFLNTKVDFQSLTTLGTPWHVGHVAPHLSSINCCLDCCAPLGLFLLFGASVYASLSMKSSKKCHEYGMSKCNIAIQCIILMPCVNGIQQIEAIAFAKVFFVATSRLPGWWRGEWHQFWRGDRGLGFPRIDGPPTVVAPGIRQSKWQKKHILDAIYVVALITFNLYLIM